MAALHYRELVAWQKAMDLVVEVYELTKLFPPSEVYGLTNQLRRAAVSIPSNIAEGQGRGVGASFGSFLRISRGSLQEVETQLLIAVRLGYVLEERLGCALRLCDETSRLISGLLRSTVD